MILAEVLQQAVRDLLPSDTARLDAEILLAHVLQVTRAYLISHSERILSSSELNQFQSLIRRRQAHEPVAYLTGHKEFWSLDLKVTPATLIPRPETEMLVELILNQNLREHAVVADLGTGTGAVSLSIAHERPSWQICATDISSEALQVAAYNALSLNIKNIQFYQGHWCEALPAQLFDAILSNPPYISPKEWQEHPPELSFEPLSALVSEENGFKDIHYIIASAIPYLKIGASLYLEHGENQADNIRRIFQNNGYTQINSYRDLSGKERVTAGIWSKF